MRVNITASSRREQWHIDHVNHATDAADLLARVRRWERATFKDLEDKRPEDVDGFRRQLAYLIADLLRQMPRFHPAAEFCESMPEIPGGGWTPVPHKGRPPAVEHP